MRLYDALRQVMWGRRSYPEGSFGEFLRPDDGLLAFQTVASHLARYYFAALFSQGCYVLDVACGSGYGASLMSAWGARRVVGVDVNWVALSCAKQYFGRSAAYIRADATNLPFAPKTFDLTVSLETIEHLHEPRRFLEEVVRTLRDDGRFICSTPNAKDPWLQTGMHSKWHHQEFTPEEFREILRD
jgi:SAM-dependent methyltransferase